MAPARYSAPDPGGDAELLSGEVGLAFGKWGSLGGQAVSVWLERALCRLVGVGSRGGCWSWRHKVGFLARSRPLGSGVACVPRHGSTWRRLGSRAGRGFRVARAPCQKIPSGGQIRGPNLIVWEVVPHHGAIQRILLRPAQKGNGEGPRPSQANSGSLIGDQNGRHQILRAFEYVFPLIFVILVSPGWFCARTSSNIFKAKGGRLLI